MNSLGATARRERVKFPGHSIVSARKQQALRARIEALGIDLAEIEERFVRASGPGGQNVNKRETGVQLRYRPLGIVVKWTRERSQALNRFLALRELVDEIEARMAPGTSERERKRERIRRRKARRRRRRATEPPNDPPTPC